jgi:hypothetical protein
MRICLLCINRRRLEFRKRQLAVVLERSRPVDWSSVARIRGWISDLEALLRWLERSAAV